MTRIVVSLIVATIFIVVSLSQNIIPCNDFLDFDFCNLDGEKDYFYTEKLSSPLYTGLLSFGIVFLVMFILTYLIVPKKKVIRC